MHVEANFGEIMKNSFTNRAVPLSQISPSLNELERCGDTIQFAMGNAVVEMSDSFCWKEIRLEDCDEREFYCSPDCQTWLRQLVSYVVLKLGTSPSIRIYSYRSGGDILVAVDAFNGQTNDYVAITILLAERNIYLSGPAGSQFDIALPSIIEVLSLTGSILSFTQGFQESAQNLWVCLTDTPDALQRGPKI
jgi:hypothetical protein